MSLMKNAIRTMPVPCSEWAEKLAATHPDDLSLSERATLEQHMTTCAACAAVHDEYRSMDAHILELPAVAPLPANMMQPGQLEEVTKERYETFPVALRAGSSPPRVRLSRAGKMLSSLAAVLVMGVVVGSFALLFSANQAGDMISSGPGVASPKTIYVATDVAKSVAYAINPANGAIIWKHMLGYKLTGPAIVVHELVVFASYDGSVYAYHTSNGAFVWKTRVGSGESAAPSLTPVNSSSSVVYFSTLGGSFGALRSSNGAILWQKHLSTCTQNCDEYGVQVDNGVYYVFADGLYALHADNGGVIWHDPTLAVSSSFAVMSGKVFVSKSLIVRASTKNLSNILVLRASDGQQIGSLAGIDFVAGNGVLYVETQTVVKTQTYVETQTPAWYAMRVSDGSILWRSKTAACLSGRMFGGTLSNGTIYSTINVGEVGKNGQTGYSEICAMSTRDGSILWDKRWIWHSFDMELADPTTALNGVIYDVAYLAHTTDLVARRLSDGEVLWQVPFTASLQGPTIG